MKYSRNKRRSFLYGLSSIGNLSGTIHYRYDTSDAEAIASDWKVIGGDIQYALDQYDKQQADSTEQ